MIEITLDTAVFELQNDCVLALNWYKHLSLQQRQAYIDSIGKHRAEIIRDFTVDALWYIVDIGENGFDTEALTDLWQRVRRKLDDERNTP